MSVHRVILDLCDACLDGEGGECHEAGCSLCRCAAPDLPIREQPSVSIVRATVHPLLRTMTP